MTDLSELLARAIAIAASAHQNQRDRANAPYILHPLRMMMRGQTLEEQIVAVLHDVVEDSDWTLEQLAAEGFPPQIVDAIACLTRRENENYDEFIDRILPNPLATRVKRYDLEDNMTLTRLAQLGDKDMERLHRYHTAHQRIMAKL
ncbi:MAG: phosphohydrolase [Oscillatoriales cyanobacterium C42_A2020_001]|nr:phosphohydrolase [Leptolyngbyaceae cyanobacterium C42_A2020_001]